MAVALAITLSAQSDGSKPYRSFPIVVTLQFHSLSMPFKDIKSNFSNVGIGLGTELSLNGKHNWAQQFSAVWYRNKAVGNGLLFYTQAAWRPTLFSGVFAEVKAGVGYLHTFRPVEAYRQVNSEWMPIGRKGKGLLAVPVGVSLGYHEYAAGTYFSPFVSYQLVMTKGYSTSIPLVPETLIQAGSSIFYKNK